MPKMNLMDGCRNRREWEWEEEHQRSITNDASGLGPREKTSSFLTIRIRNFSVNFTLSI